MTRPAFDGLLVIDKPAGMTSRDVVNRAQGWFPRHTRIGHTGTLDPLATGVLVVCVGIATRLTEYIQRMGKVYRAGVTLGAASDTDMTRLTGRSCRFLNRQSPGARGRVVQALRSFLGGNRPGAPAYSAANKVTGRRSLRPGPPRPGRFSRPRKVQYRRDRGAVLRVSPAGNRSALRQGNLHPIAGARPRPKARLRRLHHVVAPATGWLLQRCGCAHPRHGSRDSPAALAAILARAT